MKKYYLQHTDTVLRQLKSCGSGLTQEEAAARLTANGRNKLAEAPPVPLWRRFAAQLADPMIVVLLAAAALSALTSYWAGESFADVFIILAVVLLNAILGVLQESKAEKAIDALKQLTAATSKVLRNGEPAVIPSEELVVGDVVLLEAGDAVPADARVLEAASLQVEEAALTGESVPVTKQAEALAEAAGEVALGDRRNMLFMGSTVVYGRGRAVITGTGMDTEMGKIATALNEAKDGKTPLQQKLAQLSRLLTYMVLGVCVFMFAFSLLRAEAVTVPLLMSSFMLAISLAVAAIPEGLVAVVTIVLSMGVTRMSARAAVIRKLSAVETLGCTQVICSDKTGTLTQNKMTVVDYFGSDEPLLATGMALCCDAALGKDGAAVGEPTECALVEYAARLGLLKCELEAQQPRMAEAPFDSSRKMMSTLHACGGGVNEDVMQYTKGAPDEVLRRCDYYLQDGRELPLDDAAREQILAANRSMAGRALRVLALAYRRHTALPEDVSPAALEQQLVLVGLVGMIDPIRPEVKQAIAECRAAGIRPIMITGDHKDTAVAIAKELGMIRDEREAITGAELAALSDAEFAAAVQRYSVYARVQPEHKTRIVRAWQERGCITAMTGDGVNDAPSIKAADIGVGMGITGTDVTKNVADMVLADDNFATIVLAVAEGRRIYANIRKAIQFLLASNLSEVVSIFVATLMGFTILQPAHLLWINLITDTFPALALGMEPAEEDIMQRKPRDGKDGIFAGGVGADIAYQGVMVAALTLTAYFVGHFMESGVWEIAASADGMTMAFLTMSLAEIFHSLNMRSQRGSLFGLKAHNKYLLLAMLASLLLTTAVIYVPFLAALFGFESISAAEYAVAVGLAVLVVPIVEVVKFIQRRF